MAAMKPARLERLRLHTRGSAVAFHGRDEARSLAYHRYEPIRSDRKPDAAVTHRRQMRDR